MKVAALFVGLFRFPKWGMSRPLAVRIMNEVPVLWVLFRQARTGSRSRCSTLDCGEGAG